jgi:hypothetical protein
MASWHPARNVIAFFHVIESIQLPLEISSGMPIGHRNTLAAYQLLQKFSSGKPMVTRCLMLIIGMLQKHILEDAK